RRLAADARVSRAVPRLAIGAPGDRVGSVDDWPLRSDQANHTENVSAFRIRDVARSDRRRGQNERSSGDRCQHGAIARYARFEPATRPTANTGPSLATLALNPPPGRRRPPACFLLWACLRHPTNSGPSLATLALNPPPGRFRLGRERCGGVTQIGISRNAGV